MVGPMTKVEVVLVGVDRSETARQAAEGAAELARATGATLHIVTALPAKPPAQVTGPGSDVWYVDDDDAALVYLQALAASWPDVPTEVRCLTGKPAEALLQEAARISAGVVVVGNRNMQGVRRVLGAVAKHVVHHAPCNVYLVNTSA